MINPGKETEAWPSARTSSTAIGIFDPDQARANAEAVTRRRIGVAECPIDGIPNQKTAVHR